jgi:hypothetical protein
VREFDRPAAASDLRRTALAGGTGKYAHASGTLLSVSTGGSTNRDTFNIRY